MSRKSSFGRAGAVMLVSMVAVGSLLVAASAASADNRIVGGTTTTTNNYPWQAALVVDGTRFTGSDFDRHFCGGTLLTTRIIQTAAHCVFDTDPVCSNPACDDGIGGPGSEDPTGDGTDYLDPDDVDIIVGRDTLSGAGGQEKEVQNTYNSVGYNPATLEADFGWIVLSTAVTPNANVGLIDIAGSNEGSLWDPNSPAEVSGWGHTSQGGTGSDTLRRATVPVIPDGDCADPQVYGAEFFPNIMVCAGYFAGGIDSCQGDSGGPLVGPGSNPGEYRLVGVVSWGSGCAGINSPGVYSRIANPAINFQTTINSIEGLEGIVDTEEIYPAAGGTFMGAPNLPPQSIVSPPAAIPATPSPAATGARARALKKCKKKRGKARKKCIKRAKKLPV